MRAAITNQRLILLTTATLAAALSGGSFFATRGASAAASGSVSGQVVWCSPVPVAFGTAQAEEGSAMPLPAPAESSAPETLKVAPGLASERMPDGGIIRPIRPPVPRPIPAGAVLVAVQGTALSARTNENGSFRIEGVPVGQYLTVAA